MKNQTTEKRKRGRPRKNVAAPVKKSTGGKRGRPIKIQPANGASVNGHVIDESKLLTMSQFAATRKNRDGKPISRQRVYQLVRDKKVKSKTIGGKTFVVID